MLIVVVVIRVVTTGRMRKKKIPQQWETDKWPPNFFVAALSGGKNRSPITLFLNPDICTDYGGVFG